MVEDTITFGADPTPLTDGIRKIIAGLMKENQQMQKNISATKLAIKIANSDTNQDWQTEFKKGFVQLLATRPEPFSVSNQMYSQIGQWRPRPSRKTSLKTLDVDLSQYKAEYETTEEGLVITIETENESSGILVMKQASVKVLQSARSYGINIEGLNQEVLADETTVRLTVQPVDPKQLGFLEMTVAQNFRLSLVGEFK